jgi:hypothetical protein
LLVHQLSQHVSQNPFRKNRGRVQRVAFHPTKPFFFVATSNAVRIYNLAKQVRVCAWVCLGCVHSRQYCRGVDHSAVAATWWPWAPWGCDWAGSGFGSTKEVAETLPILHSAYSLPSTSHRHTNRR